MPIQFGPLEVAFIFIVVGAPVLIILLIRAIIKKSKYRN